MAPICSSATDGRPRVGALALAAALLFAWSAPACLHGQAGAAPAATPQSLAAPLAPARLLTGPEPLRGLPFFAPNAIRALRGEYSLGSVRVGLWYTREALVLGPEWKAQAAGRGGQARAWLLERPAGAVLAIMESGYALFLELPGDSPSLRRFAWALDEKFRVFFLNAPTDAELSFPAFVDFVP